MNYKSLLLILLFTIMINSEKAISQNYLEAEIELKTNEIPKDTISRLIYGGFIEFLNDYINGSMGMWAQELSDRGFDVSESSNDISSSHWTFFTDDGISELTYLSDDVYNENGKYSQYLSKSQGEGRVGIYQEVLLSDTVTHTFYAYIKGNTNLKLQILNVDDFQVLDSYEVGSGTEDWGKKEIKLNMLNGYNKVLILLYIDESGELFIDEASLMPDNNEGGVRAEYYNIYEKWNPGSLRYPGGSFVSSPAGHWTNALGHIDKRISPQNNWGSLKINQRMDFGYLEFFEFCKSLNIEPYIVASYTKHTVQDHLDYLEFLLGDKNSEFGSLRAELGHPEPFDFKYYEIGNEEWEDNIQYAKDFKEIYKAIKEKYPQLRVIAAGTNWSGKEWVSEQMEIVRSDIDIYGWHPTKSDGTNPELHDTVSFLSIQGTASVFTDFDIEYFYDICLDYDVNKNFRVGLTEWWSHYGTPQDWILDTNWRNNSLESGLWDAGVVIGMMKWGSRVLEIANRTQGMSWINRKINKNTGKKAIFPSVGLKALTFLNSHRGSHIIPIEVKSDKYFIHDEGVFYIDNMDYLGAGATFTDDSVYLYLINRSPNKPLHVNTNLSEIFGQELNGMKYELTSDHFLDHLTPEYPNSIEFSSESISLTGNEEIELNPHSMTVYSIKNDVLTNISDNTEQNFQKESYIVNSHLQLELKDVFNSYNLYNLNGKKILSKRGTFHGEFKFDFNTLEIGYYVLKLQNNERNKIINIIKY